MNESNLKTGLSPVDNSQSIQSQEATTNQAAVKEKEAKRELNHGGTIPSQANKRLSSHENKNAKPADGDHTPLGEKIDDVREERLNHSEFHELEAFLEGKASLELPDNATEVDTVGREVILEAKTNEPSKPLPDIKLKKATRELETAKKDLDSANQNEQALSRKERPTTLEGQLTRSLENNKAVLKVDELEIKVLKAEVEVLKASPNAQDVRTKNIIKEKERLIDYSSDTCDVLKKMISNQEKAINQRLTDLKIEQQSTPQDAQLKTDIRQLETGLNIPKALPQAPSKQSQPLQEVAPKQAKPLPEVKTNQAKPLPEVTTNQAKPLPNAGAYKANRDQASAKLLYESDKLNAKSQLVGYKMTKGEIAILKASDPDKHKVEIKHLESKAREQKKEGITSGLRVIDYEIKELNSQIKALTDFNTNPANKGKNEAELRTMGSLIEQRNNKTQLRSDLNTTMIAAHNFKPLPEPKASSKSPSVDQPVQNAQTPVKTSPFNKAEMPNAPTIKRINIGRGNRPRETGTQPKISVGVRSQPGRTPIAERKIAETAVKTGSEANPVLEARYEQLLKQETVRLSSLSKEAIAISAMENLFVEFKDDKASVKQFVDSHSEEIKSSVENFIENIPKSNDSSLIRMDKYSIINFIGECLESGSEINFNISPKNIQFLSSSIKPQYGDILRILTSSKTPIAQQTAEKTNEASSTIPTNIPPTQTQAPQEVAASESAPKDSVAAFNKFKTEVFKQTFEIATSEKRYAPQIALARELKELFLNPDSPDAKRCQKQLDEMKSKMTDAQKKEFDQVCKFFFENDNIELIEAASKELNSKLEAAAGSDIEAIQQRISVIDKKIADNAAVQNKQQAIADYQKRIDNPNTHPDQKKQLEQEKETAQTFFNNNQKNILTDEEVNNLLSEKAEILKQNESLSTSIEGAFREFNPDKALVEAYTNYTVGMEQFERFMMSVPGSGPAWTNLMTEFTKGKPDSYQGIVQRPTFREPFVAISQRMTKYPLLARELNKSVMDAKEKGVNFESPDTAEFKDFASNAPKTEKKLGEATGSFNTRKAEVEDQYKSQKIQQKAQQLSYLINNNADPTGRISGEQEKLSGRQRLASIVGKPTKSDISDAQVLKYTRDKINEGLKLQTNRYESLKNELANTTDPSRRSQIETEMQDVQSANRQLTGSLSKLNTSEWAQKIDSRVTIESLDLESTGKAENILNKHNLPETVTVSAKTTPASELKALNAEAKELVLSSGFEKNEQKLKELEGQAKGKIDSFVSQIVKNEAKGTPASEAEIHQVIDDLGILLSQNDSPEIKENLNKLFDFIGEKGHDLTQADVKNITDAFKMIESNVLHKMEMQALPDKAKQLEKQREIKRQSAELDQIKTTVKEASEKDKKLKLTDEGLIETKRHSTDILGMSTVRTKEGTSVKAELTVITIINKLQNADPSLGGKVSEIAKDMLKDSWVKTVLDHHPELKTDLEACASKTSASETVPTDFKNELLNPPGNPEFQTAFLTSYRGDTIKELTGDKRKENTADSEKLFNYVSDRFSSNDTNLYQKQQLMNLAEQWVNDPFIHSGDVNRPEIQAQINNLAKLAAESGSPTLRAQGEQLKASLEEAKKVAPQAAFKNGTVSLQEAISDIATGKIKVGSKEYKAAVKDFAASLTAQRASTLTAIKSSDFRDAKWDGTLKNAMEDMNNLAHFVEASVLVPDPSLNFASEASKKEWLKQSAKTYEFFVDVQQELLSSDNEVINYNDAYAIMAGLNINSIDRLSDMKALVPEKTKEMLASTQLGLFNPEKNSKALKAQIESLRSQNQAFIPYIGLHLTEYTFVQDGNPTLDENQDINSEKILMFEPIVKNIGDLSQSVVAAASNQAKYDLNVINERGAQYNGDLNYDVSLLMQPKKG